jgi:hypothetical protein
VLVENVREERDASLQIVLGAMDTRYCAVANVADPVRIKERISNLMTFTITSEAVLERDGLVGTRSLRKMAVTFARNQGMTKVSLCLSLF